MQRIMIIGSPGSGKSTLAHALGERFGIPVFHMDREVHWLPGWQERPREDKSAIVRRIISEDAWVFEGGNSATYAERLARAEMLIWLDLPVGLRLWRVIRRAIRERGKTRPDLADNCPERLNMLPEFIGFILRTRVASRRKQRAVFEDASCSRHCLSRQHEIDTFLKRLEISR
ncbi:MAG: AAA family ATPase [Pseudomonadota bacterium]